MTTFDEIESVKDRLPDPISIDRDRCKIAIHSKMPVDCCADMIDETINITNLTFTKVKVRQGLEFIDVWQFDGPVIMTNRRDIERIAKENLKTKWSRNWSKQ